MLDVFSEIEVCSLYLTEKTHFLNQLCTSVSVKSQEFGHQEAIPILKTLATSSSLFQNHLRNVVTEKIASIRHVIWTKYSRRERHFIQEHLFAGFNVPLTDEMVRRIQFPE